MSSNSCQEFVSNGLDGRQYFTMTGIFEQMGTTTKALNLLNLFSVERSEIGLSAFAQLAGLNKATTYRLLVELCETGFIEQNRQDKLYRIGPALLRLASVRERSFPMKKAAKLHVEELVAAVHETTHVTLIQGEMLSPVHSLYSTRFGTRVQIDDSELLPLHATASGIAVMAFGEPSLLGRVLDTPLKAITANTVTTTDNLRAKVDVARRTGFSTSNGEFEDQVCGIAVPLYTSSDPGTPCAGAIAVAFPATRADKSKEADIRKNLVIAATEISKAWGGGIPEKLQGLWREANDAR